MGLRTPITTQTAHLWTLLMFLSLAVLWLVFIIIIFLSYVVESDTDQLV